MCEYSARHCASLNQDQTLENGGNEVRSKSGLNIEIYCKHSFKTDLYSLWRICF